MKSRLAQPNMRKAGNEWQEHHRSLQHRKHATVNRNKLTYGVRRQYFAALGTSDTDHHYGDLRVNRDRGLVIDHFRIFSERDRMNPKSVHLRPHVWRRSEVPAPGEVAVLWTTDHRFQSRPQVRRHAPTARRTSCNRIAP
jgi:hypothetical protein